MIVSAIPHGTPAVLNRQTWRGQTPWPLLTFSQHLKSIDS